MACARAITSRARRALKFAPIEIAAGRSESAGRSRREFQKISKIPGDYGRHGAISRRSRDAPRGARRICNVLEKCSGDATYSNESLPRSQDQCSGHAEKRCDAATATATAYYSALQGSEDDNLAEAEAEDEERADLEANEEEEVALKIPGSETEDTEDNGGNAEEESPSPQQPLQQRPLRSAPSSARHFTFLRRLRSPRFGEAHHRRVPTPMKRKHRKRKREDISDNDPTSPVEEPPSPNQAVVPDPYYPIYLPIDQSFKAKYVFHQKKGKTFQERLYVFLEHPGGWMCFVYHFAV